MVGSSLPDMCVYFYGLHLSGGDFYNEHSPFSSNDLLMPEVINDDLLSALKVYYEKVEDYDSLAWGDLLLCRKIKERGRQEILDKLSLWDIFTTGLLQEDADIYYSS